jgi:quercetin dioxygenase-like cupin family protein
LTRSIETTSLAILVQGKFQYRFPEAEIVLARQGDNVLWPPGVFHTWAAVQDSVILTIRWPSKPNDVVVAD